MELNREQIIKALECLNGNRDRCDDCSILKVVRGNRSCKRLIIDDALSLINELTEENERLERICHSYALQYGTATDKEVFLKKERADTVRKMQTEIEARCINGGIYPAVVKRTIDQIAEEMIKGEKP